MPKSLMLVELLAPWLTIPAKEKLDIRVERLELDSRRVSSGCTFVAVNGHSVDGRDFIDSAVFKGANAVIAQANEINPHGIIDWRDKVPVIYIEGLHQHLSQMANRLIPLEHNRLIAVTGTNGKTTITQLIAQWLCLLGEKTAVLGTTGNGFLEQLQPATNTTGHAFEIQHTLSDLERQGARYTAMEVSSHGLVQGRVKALKFAVGVFSNLSRDHLDYHGTMEHYALAKRSLFSEHHCSRSVINIDDPIGASWAAELHPCIPVSLSPIKSGQGVYATHIDYSDSGIEITFSGQFGDGCFFVPLIGEFNASNVLLAFATILSLGYEKNALIDTANQLKSVLGRMELFQAVGKAKIVVDYAHTPDALEKALLALKKHCRGRLWAIFGCGGDRDKGKRPLMAAIGESLADTVILTDDNPRSEQPTEIVKDMLNGMMSPTKVIVEHDRYQALAYALQHSNADDIIFLAGKGHEDYQIIGDERRHYSDRESAAQLLELTL
ncbi:UDP-N-acetylmuramoyl-L-alanyl-D-glutamate--2,6-diaminopimelate ligase [Vibrio zhanjiangensis]|uniref:UDP-N-acetylmuramoyl-L-alanyl-D-glutamate--2,6-diaminopimelate ligase n=1 Tax=Vibrio zhanjiangensis TaxID=1046128 RepID=A0ABQ6F0I6_9VIBR|nr:UDP-N-acetylmuramoyl-L-alanyl-D-glutamate--2,6-diaminopimelate ligase [Vibrio zhanjiangensis]GLT18529.1 UDP-N-acetylmuramoyl-L-alanyl-D-glutamate--2,6-diaminopimelate ligase [Vibrio zhanjiangensis]